MSNRNNNSEDERNFRGSRNVECHNHEFTLSTDYEEDDECRVHNHRFSGVTGPGIRCGKSHIHKVETFVDTFDDHFHKICDETGPAMYLPSGKHFHIVKGDTSKNDDNNHDHDYYFTTAIENPTQVPKSKEC